MRRAHPDPTLLTALKAATKDLLYLSESDAPLTPFAWKTTAATTPEEALRESIPTTEPVRIVSVEEFFASQSTPQDWHTAEERAIQERFVALVQFLTTQLQGTQALRVGAGSDITVYVVGRAPDGSFVGVRTRVVET